jgi:hypothetical protein
MIASVCTEGNKDLPTDKNSDVNVNKCDEDESQ